MGLVQAAFRALFVLTALVGLGVGAAAQEVTVSDPVPIRLATQPFDQPVRLGSHPAPAYPDPWLAGSDPHWAAVSLHIGADGKIRTLDLHCEDAATASLQQTIAGWAFEPARYQGRPVEGACKIQILYNHPAGPDAPVRLVQASIPPPLPATADTIDTPDFKAHLSIDADGHPGLITFFAASPSAGEGWQEPIRQLLQQWTFAPAREKGKPVPAGITLFLAAPNDNAMDFAAPRVLSRVDPEYPDALRAAGNRGVVQVNFTVATDGRPQNPAVTASTHRAFEAPALAALMQYRFAPARIGGRPVPFAASRSIVFLEADAEDLLHDIQRHAGIVGLGSLDAAPKVVDRVLPVLPPGTPSGEVLVQVFLDRRGHARFPTALKTSSPALVEPVLAAVAQWRFTPPLTKGQPVEAVLQIPIVCQATP